MGKKADKKKIRTIEIEFHKSDFKNLRDIAEMIGYDSVEEYVEDAIVRVANADYNMITLLAEEHLARLHEKVRAIFSDEKEAESEEKEVIEASEEAAPVKEVPHKTTRRAKKEEKVEEAAVETAEKTEA